MLRPVDSLFIDRLLNRGCSVQEVCKVSQAAFETGIPEHLVERRVEERAAQAEIAKRLPPGIEQRSAEWYAARDKIVTASDFNQAAFGTDAAKRAFIAKKTGVAAPFTGNEYTRHGQKYEDLARLLYEKYMSCEVKEHGLLFHPSEPIVGASPDGVTSFALVEIKVPSKKTLIEIPPEYFAQMQGQMEVTDFGACDFVVCRVNEFPESRPFWERYEEAYQLGYEHERYGSVGSKAVPESDLLKYRHSPPGLSPDALRAWIIEDDTYEYTLHHVFDFRITRVYRDQDYIARMIAGLKETWERVTEARENPKSRQSQPPRNEYVEAPIIRGFAFRQPR